MSLKRHLKELNLAGGQIPGMAGIGADQARGPIASQRPASNGKGWRGGLGQILG